MTRLARSASRYPSTLVSVALRMHSKTATEPLLFLRVLRQTIYHR